MSYNNFGRRFSFFRLAEAKADMYLEDTRYLLNGKFLMLDDDVILTDLVDNSFLNYSTIYKIYTIAKAVFYSIAGVLIKAFVWALDFSYIKKRNKFIFEYFKNQANFKQQSYTTRPVAFKSLVERQDQSIINSIPKELQIYILSFLSNIDRLSFAKTCKEKYIFVTNFLTDLYDKPKRYPKLIVEALGKEKLTQLPLSILPGAWNTFFGKAEEFADDLEKECLFNDVSLLLLTQTISNHAKELSSLMKNDPIQKVRLSGGSALIIRIKDNILKENQVFVIAKIKKEWMIVTNHLSGAMWLFLNQLRFDEKSPLLLDYLKRLFNGEPCGNFPEILNSDIRVNLKKDDAAALFKEGPQICPDGSTPVIQLWQPN